MQSVARRPTLIEIAFPGTGLLRDILSVVGFTGVIVIFAQIAVRLPFTPVPITGQTLGVLLAGAALGSKRGALSAFLYMLLGTFGVPVFAPSSSALAKETVHFIFPWIGTGAPVWVLGSGGYIIGFVVAAYLVGYLAERGWDRKVWVAPGAMLLGNIVIYLFGLLWLGYFIASEQIIPGIGKTYAQVIPGSSILDKTLVGGLYPFIPGDITKLVVASLVLPGAWEIVGRVRKSKP